MAQKWQKNDQKMAKNDPNDLKIWHNMYLGGFYWFKNFLNFLQKIPLFVVNNHIFFCRLGKNLKTKSLDKKFMHFFNFAQNWPIFCQNVPWHI